MVAELHGATRDELEEHLRRSTSDDRPSVDVFACSQDARSALVLPTLSCRRSTATELPRSTSPVLREWRLRGIAARFGAVFADSSGAARCSGPYAARCCPHPRAASVWLPHETLLVGEFPQQPRVSAGDHRRDDFVSSDNSTSDRTMVG